MDKNKIISKDVEYEYSFKVCPICGCRQYTNNFARHVRSKRHRQVDYVNNNRFEITKIKPKDDKSTDVIFKK